MEMELRKITQDELEEILEKHKLWLESDGYDGERADLSYTDLSGLNLVNANLSRANLRSANMAGADLRLSKLRFSLLSDVNLVGAKLTYANMKFANLERANLGYADLTFASLTTVDLFHTNLTGANLTNADLKDANLKLTDLTDVDLTAVKNLPDISMACPETGSFIGWKKAGRDFIIKLEIPEDAKRSSAIGSRKCRCNKSKVLSIENIDGTPADVTEASSFYDPDFIYKVGETVEVPDFDENRYHECSNGIHFFVTREEAVVY